MHENNAFVSKLSSMVNISDVEKNTLGLPGEVLETITSNLELANVTTVYPLYVVTIPLTNDEISRLGVDQAESKNQHFYVWVIVSNRVPFFLIGTKVPFFEKITINNPFLESDAFDLFAERIKSALGFEKAELYQSEGGFYLIPTQDGNEKMFFFLYKV